MTARGFIRPQHTSEHGRKGLTELLPETTACSATRSETGFCRGSSARIQTGQHFTTDAVFQRKAAAGANPTSVAPPSTMAALGAKRAVKAPLPPRLGLSLRLSRTRAAELCHAIRRARFRPHLLLFLGQMWRNLWFIMPGPRPVEPFPGRPHQPQKSSLLGKNRTYFCTILLLFLIYSGPCFKTVIFLCLLDT